MSADRPQQYFTVTLRINGKMGWYRFGAADRPEALAFVDNSDVFERCEIIRVHSLGYSRPKIINKIELLRSQPSENW